MAQKNILNKIKTENGYDTLYPLTPYQVHQAKSVVGDGSNYALTIDLPAEHIIVPIIISFAPNIANLADCTISVNGLASKPLYINNMPSVVGVLNVGDICLIQYDINSENAKMIALSSAYMFPKGSICMWSGATVPAGWYLCDGTNGTPDLRSRFIVGSGSGYAIGATGGSNTVTLQTINLPIHSHTLSLSGISISSAGEHSHVWYSVNNDNNYASYPGFYSTDYFSARISRDYGTEVDVPEAGGHTHTLSGSGSLGSVGSGSAHENRPPYYALAFIMKA